MCEWEKGDAGPLALGHIAKAWIQELVGNLSFIWFYSHEKVGFSFITL